MKFFDTLPILFDIKFFIQLGFPPTLRAILRSPRIIFSPTLLSRVFMSGVWAFFGDCMNVNSHGAKQTLITPYASGTVLDIGAGHGHSVDYFDWAKVTKYIALEPNVLMHDHIRVRASEAGYHESDGSLVILSCGAEDSAYIISSLDIQVDTLISCLTLCSVPSPQKTLSVLIRDILKPGGQFLFYEHVLSPYPDVARLQRFWSPIWRFIMDGCRMDRPTHLWVQEMGVGAVDGIQGMWAEGKTWDDENDSQPDTSLFWKQIGRYVKY